ncbi:MAG: right-handed parallel beta-helix repeat-containing protein [Planctomycetota bacterium]|nr:right-handed parallel beta-helix repeat-containing protein [Planctomycetota bacterium]
MLAATAALAFFPARALADKLPATRPAAVNLFVSPAGDDANAGDEAHPFASLEQARDTARRIRQAQPDAAMNIWLLAGIHRRTHSFVLDAADSGIPSAPVTYGARPGQAVRLSGGQPLDRAWFTPTHDSAILSRIVDPAARTQIMQVDLKAHGVADLGEIRRRGYSKNDLGGTPPPQLYVNGRRMILARWPNPNDQQPGLTNPFVKPRRGVVTRAAIIDPGPKFGEPGYADRGPIYKCAFDRPQHWSKADDIWLDGIFNASWEWSYNRVARIDPVAKAIAMRYGECMGVADTYSGDFFFAENLIEELDRPGEYWIDRATGILYLFPPADFDKPGVGIELTALSEPMLSLAKASHVAFRGLALAFGRGMAAQVAEGEGITFDQCDIRHFAAGGVALKGKALGLRACRLQGIGGTAVALAGGDPLTLEPGGCFVEDCEILDTGWYHRVYHPAIAFSGVGQRASHNRIQGHPHMGLRVAGNDQLVEANDIGEVCSEFSDMGAIYVYTGSDPYMRGNIIRGNYIHDLGRFPMQNGVYPDNATMGVLIERNLFARIGGGPGASSNSRAVNNNSGAHILTRDNIFIDCPTPYLLSAHSGGAHFEKHTAEWKKAFADHPLAGMPHAQRYPELLKFWEEQRQYPTINTYERNLIWNPTRPLLKNWQRGKKEPLPLVDGSVAEYDGLRRSDNWTAPQDPGFANAAAGDYALKPGAAVFAHIPGFTPIAFHEVGPRGPIGAPGAGTRSMESLP